MCKLDGHRPIGRAHGERQLRVALEEPIDGGCRGAALGDGPDDQRLSATGVTGQGIDHNNGAWMI